MSASPVRVAIVGGGIGGLAAAFLHRAGSPSVVYEQAPELKEVGAGLVLAPNAVRLLRRLGAMDRLKDQAVPLEVGWEFRRWADGRVLSAEDLVEACERLYGERTSVTVRGDRAVLAFADGTRTERRGGLPWSCSANRDRRTWSPRASPVRRTPGSGTC
jgi:2-polyprenyl-6-methoxyphenol hydroxylase-like FAD-dependent oxidoreductase